MKYGCCTGAENAEALARAGYDFIDLPGAAIAALDDGEFATVRAGIERAGLPCLGMHASVPADVKLAGPGADAATIESYFSVLAGRARLLGCPRIGVGSPLSRNRTPETDPASHAESYVSSLRVAARICAEEGVTILVEALRPAETNFINTQAEALDLVERIDADNVGMIFDLYHFLETGEDLGALSSRIAERIAYLHIAQPAGRAYPTKERLGPFVPIVSRLSELGCPAESISVEAPGADFRAGHEEALAALKRLFDIGSNIGA